MLQLHSKMRTAVRRIYLDLSWLHGCVVCPRAHPYVCINTEASHTQTPSGRRPVWTEGGELFTVRYVRAQPSSELGDLLRSTPPVLRIPARYMPSGLKKVRCAAA